MSHCGCAPLTNKLGGLGNDFYASPRLAGTVGGMGVTVAGIVGSFLLPGLASRLPLRPLYLWIGVAGSIMTLVLILLSRTAPTFALAMLAENAFQSLAIACSTAIYFETSGQNTRWLQPISPFCRYLQRSQFPTWLWMAGVMD